MQSYGTEVYPERLGICAPSLQDRMASAKDHHCAVMLIVPTQGGNKQGSLTGATRDHRALLPVHFRLERCVNQQNVMLSICAASFMSINLNGSRCASTSWVWACHCWAA